MPVIKRFARCRIVVYPRDHRPPHVHVEFSDGDRCTVDIATSKVTGSVRPVSKLVEPVEWVDEHRELLMQRWQEIIQ